MVFLNLVAFAIGEKGGKLKWTGVGNSEQAFALSQNFGLANDVFLPKA